MNTTNRLLFVAALLGAAALCAPSALAHGSLYPPPPGGCATPPAPPSPGNKQPAGAGSGPVDPGTPAGPAGPAVSGAPVGLAAPSGPASGGQASALLGLASSLAGGAPAASGWSDWWEVNKDPLLALKGHVYSIPVLTGSDDFFLGHGEREDLETRRPTQAEIERIAVPALRAALLEDASVDIVSGALMALAKIGRNASDRDSREFTRLFMERLSDGSEEIRETAAIALGVLGHAAAREILAALVHDEPFGRALVRKAHVGERTRAFAAFGLGYYGARAGDPARRSGVVSELALVLDAGPRARPDLEVACVTAMGLVPLAARTGSVPSASAWLRAASAPQSADSRRSIDALEDQVAFLMELLEDDGRDRHVRAHVPAALARLCSGTSAAAADQRELVLARLLATIAPRSKQDREVIQGAILALGELARAEDVEVHGALRVVLESSAGDVERYFALIALGRAGGRLGGPASDVGAREVTRTLLRSLARGAQTRRAWAALALGIQAYGVRATGAEPSADVARALRAELARSTAPEIVGATAVALGLLGDGDAGELLLTKLEQVQDDRARGYLCVGLGLLGEQRAASVILELAGESEFRPSLLAQSAVSLGLLRDVRAVPRLIEMLDSANSQSGQAGIAIGLGTIGDSRSFLPLAAFLTDASKTTTARAFAAVALGIASDRELLPWNEVLRTGVQYRAATVTLRSPTTGTGVLDIL